MVRSVINVLLLAAVLLPASVAVAQDAIVYDAKARCLTPPKGYIKSALEKKLTDDLKEQGLIQPKVRVRLNDVPPAGDQPDSLRLKDFFKDTKLIVTPVACPVAPCITPPTISYSPAATAVLGTCSVSYDMDSKHGFWVETTEQVDGRTRTKRVKIEGSLTSRVTIPGYFAPYAKRK